MAKYYVIMIENSEL